MIRTTVTATLPNGHTLTASSPSGINWSRLAHREGLWQQVADALDLPGAKDGVMAQSDRLVYDEDGPDGLYIQRGTAYITRAIQRDDGVWDYFTPESVAIQVAITTDFRERAEVA